MSSENKLVFYVNGREVSFHASNVDYYTTWISKVSAPCAGLLGLYQSIILFAITCLLDHSRSNCEVTIQHSIALTFLELLSAKSLKDAQFNEQILHHTCIVYRTVQLENCDCTQDSLYIHAEKIINLRKMYDKIAKSA